MPRELHWKELTPGLIGLGAVLAVGIAVLMFARVGGVRGKKSTIYVVAATATGVLKGTEVMVAGKRAGTVESIEVLPPSADTANLLLEVTVLDQALLLLRRDARALIRPSGTIIGAPIIDLIPATTASPALRAGDTLRADPQMAAETIIERVGGIGGEFSGLIEDAKGLRADLNSIGETMSGIRTRGPRDVAAFRRTTAAAIARLSGGRGSIGLVGMDRGLQQQVASLLASMDTLGTLLASDRGSIGRFRRDTTLQVEMEQARAELGTVRAALAEARGTAGRLERDRALSKELDELQTELDALTEDVKKNPFRYLTF